MSDRPPESDARRPEAAGAARGSDAPTAGRSPPTESLIEVPSDFSPAGLGMTPVIEGYVIYREIHRGGQGVVYEALQKSTNRKVAIKMLLDDRFASDAAKRRFEREVKLVAQLHHVNIITIHDSGVTAEGRCFYVMDYVRGSSLRQYVQENRLPLARTLELLAGVCAAVEHAHQRGVIHRDLKPSNILVRHDGVPVVLDFGLAKSLGATVETVVSMSGQLIGTWPYMSPEQTRGRPDAIDARSDVYALGVVLYELLTGHFPYPIAGTLEEVLKTIRETPPELPSRKWNSSLGVASRADGRRPIDDKLDAILLKALSKEPGRRYASAGDFASDLERYLRGEAIAARRDSVTYLLRKRGRALAQRHRVTSFVAAVVTSFAFARFLGVQLVYRWTPINARFEGMMTRFFAALPTGNAFEHVRVIGFDDDTDFEVLARTEGLADVSNDDLKTVRGIHARLMHRLVGSGCKVVVWDITFRSTTPWDDDLAEGVRALGLAGIDVVVAVPEFWLGAEARPELIAPLALESRPGVARANLPKIGPWGLYVVARREMREPVPSLALAAFAAYRRPRADVRFEIDSDGKSVQLVYRDSGSSSVRSWPGSSESIKVELTAVRAIDAHDPLIRMGSGLLPDDWMGYYTLEVPPDAVLSGSTLAYQRVFAMGADELRREFEGRIVVIANLRSNSDDWRDYYDGRRINGCYSHSVGLEGLVQGTPLRVPRFLNENLFPLAAAVAGAFTALVLRMWTPGRYIALGIWGGIACLATIVAYREFRYFLNPVVPLLALWLASETVTFCRYVWASRSG